MDSKEFLNLNNLRRFGVEIEINSFDMKNRPVARDELPEGIYYVGNLVKKNTRENVCIHKWSNDHNNNSWIIKPDASCGLEVCSPVLKGWNGLMQVCSVIDAFRNDYQIRVDDRCSFHVHAEIGDLTEELLASVISWWIKCEPVFLDSVPSSRKINQYCQFLGLMDFFETPFLLKNDVIIRKVGFCKYYTINTYHLLRKNRKTIEFRIMDGKCCVDPWMAKNWTRLLLHFIECAVSKGLPQNFSEGNRWSGYCWLDPIDVFEFLGFNSDDISPGLKQVREWFLTRLKKNVKNDFKGAIGNKARVFSQNQINQLCDKFLVDKEITNEEIYGSNFRV